MDNIAPLLNFFTQYCTGAVKRLQSSNVFSEAIEGKQHEAVDDSIVRGVHHNPLIKMLGKRQKKYTSE